MYIIIPRKKVFCTSETQNTLLHGPVRPALLRYAFPIILSMVATQFYSVADTMIIGLRLDADALAAVSNASTVLMIFLFISGGMELGGGLLVAAGKPTATRQEMAELLYNLIFVDLALALGLTALGFFTLPALLRFIRTPEEILAEAVLYGRVYLVGLPFLMLYDLTKQCVMGCGDSKTPLRAVVATSVMNILLDLALVGPFGVAGAAGATAAAQIAGAVYMLAHLRKTELDTPFRREMLKARYAKEIFRLSAPNSLQQASGTIITTVKQGLLVAALCIGLNGPLLRLFTTDAAAAAYGSTMLAYEGLTYIFTAQKHLCEARLRGAQKMGLYLASNLGQIGLNLRACVLLVPRIGFSGFWLSTWISAPAGLVLAALLAKIGAKQT